MLLRDTSFSPPVSRASSPAKFLVYRYMYIYMYMYVGVCYHSNKDNLHEHVELIDVFIQMNQHKLTAKKEKFNYSRIIP